MIEVRSLRKCFGEVVAVDDVSFTAKDGHVTGLIGPNGAGKTTALRVLYGLLDADQGEVLVDGVSVGTAPQEAQRRMGVLPDSRGLYVRLTAREHLRYFGRLQGLSASAVEENIDRLVTQLDMGAIIDRRVQGFSQGERRSVVRSSASRRTSCSTSRPTGSTLGRPVRCDASSGTCAPRASASCSRVTSCRKWRRCVTGS